MVIFPVHPAKPFDLDDLLALPGEDGLRYEVIDGALVVTAAPSWNDWIEVVGEERTEVAEPVRVVVCPADLVR